MTIKSTTKQIADYYLEVSKLYEELSEKNMDLTDSEQVFFLGSVEFFKLKIEQANEILEKELSKESSLLNRLINKLRR